MTERVAEIPWAVSNAVAPVLDVGCAESSYLADLPAPVDGIDVRPCASPALHDFYRGDIREYPLPQRYATVLAVSTLEHVGLACDAYGTIADDPDGDRRALDGCVGATAPGGKVLVSVPFGNPGDHVWFRQYDLARLARLLDGYDATIDIRLAGDWARSAPVADVAVDYANGAAGAVALITVRREGP